MMTVRPCTVTSHSQTPSDAMCVFFLKTGHVFSQQSCERLHVRLSFAFMFSSNVYCNDNYYVKSMVFYQWTWTRQQAFCCCSLFVNSVGSTMEHRKKLLQCIIKYRSILLLAIVLLWIWFSDLNAVYTVNLVGRELDDMVGWYLRFSYNLQFWMVFLFRLMSAYF